MAAVKIWYDREGDFLEVIFEDSPGALEEMAEDIFERRTAEGRVVGFAVFNFSKHDKEKLTLPLALSAVRAA